MFKKTPAVRIIFYINIIMFLISMIDFEFIITHLGLYSFSNPNFRPWQMLTHMFLHGGFMHILFNMLGLLSILPAVEERIGSKKFTIYYLICGLFAATFNIFMTNTNVVMVGASGALWGMIIYFTVLFPNLKLYLLLIPIGIKAKYLISSLLLLEIILATTSDGDGVAHYAHIGGAIMGISLYLIDRYILQKKNKVSYIRKAGF